MADLTPYAITLGSTDYPSKYAGLLAYLEALLDANEENALGRNKLINGAFGFNYRAASSIADDVYGHDRWYALTQSGSIAVSTLTDVENGTPFMARLTQSQATAQRMGYAQIIEGINCKHMRGKTVTFEVNRLRLSTAANVRMAVLEWTGTEDAVTSDVVLNWTSGTYTAGNFFLASNLTVSGVVQQALTANTLTDGTAVTVTLGSSFNNLIVFVWTESAVAQNVTLDLGKAQLEIGSVATLFEHRPYGAELALCQRYYYRQPAATARAGVGQSYSTTAARLNVPFPVVMRAKPTSVEQSGTAADYTIVNGTNTVVACSAVPTFDSADELAGQVIYTTAGSLTAGQAVFGRNVSSAYLGWSAEL